MSAVRLYVEPGLHARWLYESECRRKCVSMKPQKTLVKSLPIPPFLGNNPMTMKVTKDEIGQISQSSTCLGASSGGWAGVSFSLRTDTSEYNLIWSQAIDRRSNGQHPFERCVKVATYQPGIWKLITETLDLNLTGHPVFNRIWQFKRRIN